MNATVLLPFSLVIRSYSGEVELHQHDFHQIVLPRSGAMEIELDGRGGKVDASQGVVIASGARHTFQANAHSTFLVLDVPAQCDSGAQTLAPLSDKRFFALSPEIRHLLDYANGDSVHLSQSPALTASWSQLLLHSLVQPEASPQDPGQLILAKALAYIERHLHTPLKNRDIARHSGTSERRLYALFERHLARTPFSHIASLRLNLAIDLLRQTSLPIIEIAHRTGYADQSALTHALKKAHGLTPASLRKRTRAH